MSELRRCRLGVAASNRRRERANVKEMQDLACARKFGFPLRLMRAQKQERPARV